MKNIYLLIFLFAFLSGQAQLTGWGFKKPFIVRETSNTAKSNYPVLLTIDTRSLIQGGSLQQNGADLRFAGNCDGSGLLPYFIESGINTDTTIVWVKIPALTANGFDTIYMYYGNQQAVVPQQASFDSVFTNNLIFTASDSLLATDTVLNYDWFEIKPGVTVKMAAGHQGIVKINARRIIINGKLDGYGKGYIGGIGIAGQGPGGGKPSQNTIEGFNLGGGGGGAHGGAGGNGAYCCNNTTYLGPGGTPYGSATDKLIDKGSGGSATSKSCPHNPGANGGGAFRLEGAYVSVGGEVNVNGDFAVSTETMFTSAGGGGAGGGILILGSRVNLLNSSLLTAAGGYGGSAVEGGGGGGGGRVKVFFSKSILSQGTISVAGSFGGATSRQPSVDAQDGGSGSIFINSNYLSPEPVVTEEFPGNILTDDISSTIACEGQPITFSAPTGYPTYDFRVNGSSRQSGASSTYTTSTLQKPDQVQVYIMKNGGCMIPSNIIQPDLNAPVTPSVSISPGSDTICPGSALTFSSFASGAGTNPIYLWKINGATVSGADGPSFTSNTLNDQDEVELILTSDEPCATPASVVSNKIRVNVKSTLTTLTISGPSELCSGSPATYTSVATGTGATPSYLWFLNGNPAGTGSSHTFPAPADGDIIYCELTTSDPCALPQQVISNTVTLKVSSSLQPSVVLTPDVFESCEGAPLTINTTVQNAGNSPLYRWKINGTTVPGATSPSLTTSATSPGVMITCEITSSLSCANPITASGNSMPVILPAPPKPEIEGPAAFCSGQTEQLSADGDSISWYVNGTLYANGNDFTIKPAAGDLIHVVSTGVNGCHSTSDTITVLIVSMPSPPVVTGLANPVCPGTPMVLSTGDNDGYQWFLNNTPVPGDTSKLFSFLPQAGDSVEVRAGKLGCYAFSGKLAVPLLTAIPAHFTANPDSVVKGGQLELTASTGGATAYDWSLSDGTTLQGASVSHVFGETGVFRVQLVTTSPDNCRDTSFRDIRVFSGTGIADYREPLFTFYPNPAASYVIIRSAEPADMLLTDITGREILSFVTMGPEQRVPLGNLPAGTYFLHGRFGKFHEVKPLLIHAQSQPDQTGW